MSNPTWPGTLPTYVLAEGYDETFGNQVIESATDGGAVKTRRRFTRRADRFACTMIMSATQEAAFDTFYYTTLGGGSLAFDWVHPRTQAAMTFKIVGGPPKVMDYNSSDVTVSFTLERQG